MLAQSPSQKFVSSWQKLCLAVIVTATLGLSQLSHAGTLVDVSTPLGDFQLELFDATAPITVTNFLNYVTSGRYDGTIVHRSDPSFVIQGGWLTFDEAQDTFFTLSNDGTISNEFHDSNIRGTIAMARVGGQVNSATSQWFINVEDNTGLDSVDGGFTVFGEVIGDGMQVVDAINQLGRFNFGSQIATVPVIDYTGGTLLNTNLVTTTMAVHEEPADPEPPVEHANTFNQVTNELDIKIDAGAIGFASASFSINTTEPHVVIQLVSSSVVMLTEAVDKMATYDDATGELLISELIVGDAVAYRNLLFVLSDAEQFLFTLLSYDEA